MPNSTDKKLAFVTSVYPNKVKIEVENLTAFKNSIDDALGDLKIGSYLEISDNDGCVLIAIIESYQIELKERVAEDDQGNKGKEVYNAYVLEASPLGTITGEKFVRGGDALTIPPTEVKPASEANIKLIYENGFKPEEKFLFAKLVQDGNIEVPVNGNKFFNKHFAIVGSSGSGKSHTIAKIIQKAVEEKKRGGFDGLNNSHVVIFDIHNEYKSAFPDANPLNISNLVLPYWLLNSEELEELFIDTEANDHNQRNVFQEAITRNKKKNFIGTDIEKRKNPF
jgi:flavin-binding protein dodecin